MRTNRSTIAAFSFLVVAGLLLAGCSTPDPAATGSGSTGSPGSVSGESPGTEPEPAPDPPGGSSAISWLDIELTDVSTGEAFRISDFKGRPVLVKSFAVW